MDRNIFDATLHIRLTSKTKAALVRAAHEQGSRPSDLVRTLTIEGLQRRGLLREDNQTSLKGGKA